jgi:hypothetical protein
MKKHTFHERIDDLVAELKKLREEPMDGNVYLSEYEKLTSESKQISEYNVFNKYLRFLVATFALAHFIPTREIAEIQKWIKRSLTVDPEGNFEEPIDLARIFEFKENLLISSHPFFTDRLISWLGFLYYISAEKPSLEKVANKYPEFTQHLLEKIPPAQYEESKAFLLSRIMTWAIQTSHPLAQKFIEMNEELALNTNATPKVRASVAIGLLNENTGSSSFPKSYWSNFILTQLADHLDDDYIFLLLASSWDGQSEKEAEKILNQLKRIRAKFGERANSRHLQLLLAGRSDLINPLVARSLRNGNLSFGREIICIWYAIDPAQALPNEKLLWAVPFLSDGMLLALGEQRHLCGRADPLTIKNLILATSRFLSKILVLAGPEQENTFVPERRGVPVYEYAEAFRDAVEAAYLPDSAKEFLSLRRDAISQQIICSSTPHPLQTVQLKTLGTTWPITASFKIPLRDPIVQKVAIWSAGGLMGGDYELSIVASIFRSHGIQVDVYEQGAPSDRTFKDVYADASYDIIWLISHGEYDHYSPKNSQLSIGEDYVGIDEMLEVNVQRHFRRLFFINVCDGATHNGGSVLPQFGFAASLASPWQATISHQWPVAALPAVAYGILFAFQISKGKAFFDAYKESVLQMIYSRGNIPTAESADIPTDKLKDLNQRLEYSQQKLSSFEHYGSAAFFE